VASVSASASAKPCYNLPAPRVMAGDRFASLYAPA
jgi:hypothetical protein